MGLEELTHTITLWLALFYVFALTAYTGRIVLLAGWDTWMAVAGFSMLTGFSMLAAYDYKPTKGCAKTSRIDHATIKIIRMYVSFILIVFISLPFMTLEFSPTPLEDFLLLTLTSYVWLVYVAILIISVIFYDKMNGLVSKEE